MTRLLANLFLFALGFVATYLAFCFVAWDMDASQWSIESRGALLIFGGVLGTIFVGIKKDTYKLRKMTYL